MSYKKMRKVKDPTSKCARMVNKYTNKKPKLSTNYIEKGMK